MANTKQTIKIKIIGNDLMTEERQQIFSKFFDLMFQKLNIQKNPSWKDNKKKVAGGGKK